MHAHAHPAHAPTRPTRDGAQRRLALVLLLTGGFMVVEVVGAVVSGSLALLADAGHMLTDCMAIGLSWAALWLTAREATHRRTYGFRRAEILAAFVNAFVLLVLAAWIVKEAVERFNSPRAVDGGILFWVAVAGLGINVGGFLLLRREAGGNLNLRSALWHIIGDLLGSLGVVAAALVIRFTGWMAVDPLIGVGIAVLIAIGSGRILLDSTNLLLDSVPRDVDSRAVREYLTTQPDVREICDLHIWAVSGTENMLTAHLVVREDAERDGLLQNLTRELRGRFHLDHLTLQLETQPTVDCADDW